MADHDNDPLLAEAIARRDESRAQILRSRANASGTAIDKLANAYGKLADQATADAKKSSEAASNVEPATTDPEGTARPLADSEGNFPANAEVASVGGIGIDASNTDVSTGKPARTIEQAGVATTEGARKIVGDQVVDDVDAGSSAGTNKVDIPANWKELTWQERRSLASKLSDNPISNGEEANAAIETELKKRG